jgi:type I restriction enzyme S subunit
MSTDKNKLIPELRFPEFVKDGEWVAKSLGRICDVRDGTHDSPKYIPDGFPLITSKNLLENGEMDFDNVNFLSREDYDKINQRSKVDVDDILFGMIGTIGNPVIVKREGFAIKNVALIKSKGELNQGFLIQLMKSEYIAQQFQKANAGGILKFIALGMIRKLHIPTPSPQEQQKIASCLSSLDEVIAANSQKLATLKDHKKGLMQNLFPTNSITNDELEITNVPNYRFPEFLEDGDWAETKLGEICSMQAGKFVSASEIKEKLDPSLFPCYGGNGLRGYTKSFTHSGKFSLIGRQGALCGNITLADGQFHATEHAVVTTPKKNTDTLWLYYELELLNLNQYATGQAQPGLSVGNLVRLKLNIPKNPKEQQKIASCLSSLDELITAQTEKIAQLKLHKKGLMQGLFPKSITN